MSEKQKVREKSEAYSEIRNQYIEGEISEQEFEERAENLLEDDTDFMEYDESRADAIRAKSGNLKQKLSYYSLPIFAVAPVVAVVLLPGISPMLAITAAPALIAIGITIWATLKMTGYL